MAGLISNGSFVLGDPNTRDLYLGKGLKDGFEGDKYYIATDETVLFSGSNTDACTLSEPLTNFECVKIYVSHDPNTIPMCCNEYDITKTTQNLHVRWHAGTGNMYDYFAYISVNDKNLVVEKTLERRTTWAASPTLTYTVDSRKSCICKVVGINRKRG